MPQFREKRQTVEEMHAVFRAFAEAHNAAIKQRQEGARNVRKERAS